MICELKTRECVGSGSDGRIERGFETGQTALKSCKAELDKRATDIGPVDGDGLEGK